MNPDGSSPASLQIIEDNEAPEQETLFGGVFEVRSVSDE
jgi:hypothetical protein